MVGCASKADDRCLVILKLKIKANVYVNPVQRELLLEVTRAQLPAEL